MRFLLLALAAVLLCAPAGPVQAQTYPEAQAGYPPPLTYAPPPPPSGIGAIVVGSVATGMAGLNLATMPLCFAEFYPDDLRGACIGSSVAIGAVGLAVGIPALVVGLNRRARYREWRAARPVAALLDLRLTAFQSGAGLAYGATF